MPAAAVGLATSVIASRQSSRAAKKAANVAQEGTSRAIAAQERQYAQTRQDMAPWREAGGRALSMLEQNLYGTPGGGLGQVRANPQEPNIPQNKLISPNHDLGSDLTFWNDFQQGKLIAPQGQYSNIADLSAYSPEQLGNDNTKWGSAYES